MSKVEKTDAEWRQEQPPETCEVARKGRSERAFDNEYWDTKTPGVYHFACCGSPLFDAGTKYDSGTGWPSFHAPVTDDAVAEHEDRKLFMRRIESVCAHCDAHLGHVFPDGPEPTGLRYCLNSAALKLEPAERDAG